METILYVDSRQRDTMLYPYGNSYTLFLQTPVRNVTQVDLVSAKIPNTMYNLTATSNVLLVNSSNVVLNPGFYSTCSLVSTFNNSGQFSNVSLDYLESEGRFIFYGNVLSVTCQTQEIADILGLSVGTTTSVSNQNKVYQGLYPGSNAYVKSSSITSLEINDYIWLDIAEFRTPGTTDARRLVLSSQGVYTTTGNTAARSFAVIPMNVASAGIKMFTEGTDYRVQVTFPSRLDSLDRLTIQWLDRNGTPLNFRGLDTNSIVLRLHTVHVPDTPERPERLPAPVPYGLDKQRVLLGAFVALIFGLLFIVQFR